MRRAWPIVALFVLSGAAGLIYEVVWARQLVLVFGNTTQAVSAILTGFFGGMALGSYVGGRVADQARRALLLYGVIEILIALVALATPAIFALIGSAYGGLFGALETNPAALGLVRFVLSLLALGPATVLLGATLPTLTRYLARGESQLSVAFGRLYAANTIGAVAGAAAAGLVLIELLGLEGALRVGALCSAAAGSMAIVLHLRWAAASPAPAVADKPAPAGGAVVVGAPGLAIGVAFISGLTSLAYQTLWTRLVASGSGNLTYVFTLILTVFLIGLAGGAAAFTVLRGRIHDPIRVLALLQAATAVLAVLGLVFVLSLPTVAIGLTSIAHIAKVTVVVVLPTTFVMGLSLPVASALVGRSDREVGADTGRLLAANTVGAILATFGIPFVLIPLIGSPLAVAVVALINGLTAVTLGWWPRQGRRAPRLTTSGVGAVACVAALVAMVGGGVVDPTVNKVHHAGGTIEARLEDEIASVQAGTLGGRQQLWVAGTAMTALTVDSRLMPILPLMLRPASRTALTVAFGMGSAYREALVAGLKTDAAELVPSVPKMFHWYFPDAPAILADPRGQVFIADGRNYVELTDRSYDIVVVDPPPPVQSSGASVISSLEFYEAARKRLTPAGVMMQWVPLGQTIDDFRDHVRTFASVFEHVIVADGPGGHGYFLLGSAQPITLEAADVRAVLARPGVVADLSSAYDSPVTTAAAWTQEILSLVRLTGPGVERFAGPGPLVTDDQPRPEYFLLRSMFGAPSPQLTSQSLDAPTP